MLVSGAWNVRLPGGAEGSWQCVRAGVWRAREKKRRRLSGCQVPGKELSGMPGKDPESTGSRWGAEGPSGATHLLPTLAGSQETDRRLAARSLPLAALGFSPGLRIGGVLLASEVLAPWNCEGRG